MPEASARDTYAQWAMTGFAFIATIISVIGVILLRRTFEETKRTAEAAIRSERTAREIGQAQVRAYVAITEVKIENFVAGQKPTVRWKITNAGLSPALRFQQCTSWRLVNAVDPYKITFRRPIWHGPAVDIVQGGHIKQDMELPEANDAVINTVSSGENLLLVYGLARYQTVFGKKCRVVFSTMLRPDSLADGNAEMIPTKRNNRTN